MHWQGRSIQNTVMELRNICNHPYLSQLHSEEVSFQGNAFLIDSVHCQQRKRQMGSLYVCVNESWWECCRQKRFSQLITCPSWSVSVESLKCLIGYCPSWKLQIIGWVNMLAAWIHLFYNLPCWLDALHTHFSLALSLSFASSLTYV